MKSEMGSENQVIWRWSMINFDKLFAFPKVLITDDYFSSINCDNGNWFYRKFLMIIHLLNHAKKRKAMLFWTCNFSAHNEKLIKSYAYRLIDRP